jgi:hypothetical protein
VPVIGEKGKKFMKTKKIKYTNASIGRVEIIKDFLPPPETLVLADETVKITLSLTKDSLEYFKKEAKIRHTPYQKMIRILLDRYVEHYG